MSEIIKNYHEGKYRNEGNVFFSLFNKEIKIYVDNDVPFEYAEKCVKHLNSLSDTIIDSFCNKAIEYCEEFRMYFKEENIKIKDNISGRDILKYIYPKVLIINTPKEDIPAFHLECDCEWEREHGLEVTIKGDEIIYLGGFNDIGAWD